jgi:hypothetical protein
MKETRVKQIAAIERKMWWSSGEGGTVKENEDQVKQVKQMGVFLENRKKSKKLGLGPINLDT